jgi:hypothetical protein
MSLPGSHYTPVRDAAAIAADSAKILKGTWAVQSTKDKSWLVVKVTKNVTSFPIGNYKYEYRYYYYKDNVEGYTKTGTYGNDVITILDELAGDAKIFPTYAKAQKALKEHVTAAIPVTVEGAGYISTDTPVLPYNGTATERWNPVSHSSTRGLPFYVNADLSNTKISKTAAEKIKDIATTAHKYSDTLGKIYQTPSSAKALNNKDVTNASSHASYVAANGPAGLWGFRFCYNPTTISYSTSLDSSIDWMLAPSDPSKFFGGNTQITFDLYLNRIADMSALLNKPYDAGYPGGTINDRQREGILNRGTEYDIEYLYRVVNGNPKVGTKLLAAGSEQETSDFGYITGMPFWLHLHDNMIFKASLSGLSVNHVLFTEKMVPMLSVVTLSFIRYPETSTTGEAKDALTNYLKTGFNS